MSGSDCLKKLLSLIILGSMLISSVGMVASAKEMYSPGTIVS